MGRAARNYGGTRGHGYFPLPGEKPNFNHHIMNDCDLFSSVKSRERKPQKSEFLKIVPQTQTDQVKKPLSRKKVPRNQVPDSKDKEPTINQKSTRERQKIKTIKTDFQSMTDEATDDEKGTLIGAEDQHPYQGKKQDTNIHSTASQLLTQVVLYII